MERIKVIKAYITLGQPLNFSVYNQVGELLLKKGKTITTEHQLKILLNRGYIFKSDVRAYQTASTKKPLPTIHQSAKLIDIFTTKEQWLGELYHLLIYSQQHTITNFSHRTLTLALDIQLQARLQHDALLASLQTDFENHYGLIHALHCAVICEMVGKSAGLGQVERLMIVAAALTHDLGIIIDQQTMHHQQQKLSDIQLVHVQQHPSKSEALLHQFGVNDKRWLDVARHHHERLDGSGYPDGLSGEKISVEARVLAIADIYCAIVHPTVFREENSGKYALTTLYKMRETQLDAAMVESFIGEVGVYPPGSLVRLKNNEIAIVMGQGPQKHIPMVCALVSPQNSVYIKPKTTVVAQGDHQIIKEEPLSKYNILLDTIEKLWL